MTMLDMMMGCRYGRKVAAGGPVAEATESERIWRMVKEERSVVSSWKWDEGREERELMGSVGGWHHEETGTRMMVF